MNGATDSRALQFDFTQDRACKEPNSNFPPENDLTAQKIEEGLWTLFGHAMNGFTSHNSLSTSQTGERTARTV